MDKLARISIVELDLSKVDRAEIPSVSPVCLVAKYIYHQSVEHSSHVWGTVLFVWNDAGQKYTRKGG